MITSGWLWKAKRTAKTMARGGRVKGRRRGLTARRPTFRRPYRRGPTRSHSEHGRYARRAHDSASARKSVIAGIP